MPQMNCPKCGRAIALDDAELVLLVECAGCDTRFYPMMPLDGAMPGPPPRAPAPPPAAAVGILEKPIADEPASALPAPRLRPPRMRKRRGQRGWAPVVIGACLGLILLVLCGVGILILVKNEAAAPQPSRPGGAAKTSSIPGEPLPPPFNSGPGGMPLQPPPGIFPHLGVPPVVPGPPPPMMPMNPPLPGPQPGLPMPTSPRTVDLGAR